MLSSLSIKMRGQEEVTLIFPSLSDLKIIQCLQAIFQLVLKSPPRLHCKTLSDLLSKTFQTDQVSWEPPQSVYQDSPADKPPRISLSDLGDIPLLMFQQVMEKIETATPTDADAAVQLQSDSEQEDVVTPLLASSRPSKKLLKVVST